MTEAQRKYAEKFMYQNVIGILLYLAINTRSDLSYPVGVLARHCVLTSFEACQPVVRVLTYLKCTPQIGIEYSSDKLNLHSFFYSDWAGDSDSRKLTTGYVLFAVGGPITWSSKLQPTIATSSMEAEYMVAFNAIQECVWVKGWWTKSDLILMDLSHY